jgi:hypothetical protein
MHIAGGVPSCSILLQLCMGFVKGVSGGAVSDDNCLLSVIKKFVVCLNVRGANDSFEMRETFPSTACSRTTPGTVRSL